jgi:predicted Fe-Mo cluster-binding NifX family protein
MEVCFPVVNDEGSASTIYGHFASAPLFVVVDAATGQSTAIANCDPDSPYAGCNPFAALNNRKFDGIVVGGANDESVRVMNMCGFRMYQAESASVAENLALFEAGDLLELEVVNSHLEGRCESDTGSSCTHQHAEAAQEDSR